MIDFVIGEGIFPASDTIKTVSRTEDRTQTQLFCPDAHWNPENFAREQIRGLVRQVFFSSVATPVSQVIFCPVESQTEVGHLCRQVGETLAREVHGNVIVVAREQPILSDMEAPPEERPATSRPASLPLRQIATRVARNLWFASENQLGDESGEPVTRPSLSGSLTRLRREFEYSIVEAPPAAESSEVAALGQLADGTILALAAHHTRRVTAYRVKQRLEAVQARILGAVLTERTFPIPERIYRRL